MKLTPTRAWLFAGACCALVASAPAQVIELRATINSAQENPDTRSPAAGSAIMLYDLAANTFDLMISITGMSNTATASHIHEGPPGVNGGVVTNLGGESAYVRDGNTLTATFRGVRHGGDKLKLISGGAYYNIHSAQFPGGEIRGQLLPRPVRLIANMDVAQEQAALPAANLAGLNDTGAAIMLYDPMSNTIRLRLSLFNFNNPFTNSHFHEGAPGVSGPVRVGLGTNPNAGGYSNANGHISGAFDIPMAGGDPIALLSGNYYLNFHSATFPAGELRGQVRVSEETPGTRFANVSVRGFVGTGDQVLIQGFTVNGPEPIRALITAKGPSLSGFGVSGPLANPRVALFDAGRRQIAVNDDVGPIAAGSDLASVPGVPTNAAESALLVVLPPGSYTAVVSAASGTGIALLEIADLRNLASVSGATAPASVLAARGVGGAARAARDARLAAGAEICAAPMLATR